MLLLTFIVAHHLIIRIFKKNVQQNLIAKPNLLMGYRSFKSLKNDKSWQFAQQMFLKYSEQVNKVGGCIRRLSVTLGYHNVVNTKFTNYSSFTIFCRYIIYNYKNGNKNN